jgi:D-alanine-D-alanine ligase
MPVACHSPCFSAPPPQAKPRGEWRFRFGRPSILRFVYQEVRRLALKAHHALGCRGVSRADFRYDDRSAGTEGLVCLEVNTQPGMTETSLVPKLANYAGLTFDELVRWMVEDASLNR